MVTKPGSKSGYHHGDLRNALVAAAVELATQGGPERVVLREAARRVGVSATAAYRHFDGQADLLWEVKAHAQVVLADRMEEAARAVAESTDPGAAATSRFLALGRGYIGFAVECPGLFRSAFCPVPAAAAADEDEGGDGDGDGDGGGDGDGPGTVNGGREPQARSFELLVQSLDQLLAHGRMAPGRRPLAEAVAWSAVHGVAELILEGPFAHLPAEERDAVIESTLSVVLAGLAAP
ncbi:TetR/AcrR family transcriptional regulator [Streptomyces palmae]|uniref:TetR/AcrR family transcriptional regulator n=1 Tax=Streptomyces palmae TaxID=1701085 RepID=A0A4Z0HG10_9ACTN|nr:TetR/AcrR family transcriptional regulator [Streptomyces palmae]TGB19579.1 TetR/AcrR family transcriptional regulator [Streptomyces palmae]